MEVSSTVIKALDKEHCIQILEEVNKELKGYNRTAPEQLQHIHQLCVMVRRQLEYLHLKDRDSGRFLSKVTKEKIEQASIEERKRLAMALSDQQDFTSKCVIDYCNQLNYEQES